MGEIELVDIINKIAKNTCILLSIYIVFTKVINYKKNNFKTYILILLLSVTEAIICVSLFQKVPTIIAVIITYIVHSFIISKIIKINLQYSIILTFISLTITYIVYISSVIIVGGIIIIFGRNIQKNNIVSLVMIALTEIIIIYRIFKIKRFKNGISFLKNKEKAKKIGIIGSFFIGITLLVYSIMELHRGYIFISYLFIGILIEAVCLFTWIKHKITKHYKQNLKENTVKELEDIIKEKDKEINRILEENNKIATINHKYSSRIKALENASAKIMSKPEFVNKLKEEFGEDFGNLEKQINKISKEFLTEMNENVKLENKIEKTGIFGIDNILEYMRCEAENKGITFNFKLNRNINFMLENIIEQSKLETLLGDHIKDAIIAIQNSENTYKNILTTIGIVDNCYEVRIYDSGIEFKIEILLKLGQEPVTTYKGKGGSGIGFMTTFETLKQTKASLIIEEKHPINSTDYTKVVIIRFDGNNEYKIKSYRAEELNTQKENDIIIIQK